MEYRNRFDASLDHRPNCDRSSIVSSRILSCFSLSSHPDRPRKCVQLSILSTGNLTKKLLKTGVPRAHFAFPNHDGLPAKFFQCSEVFLIALDVLGEFLIPEIDSSRRCARIFATRMTVPEAAIHENRGSELREAKVWLPGKVFDVKSKSQAHSVQIPTYPDFRLGVLSPNAGHHPAPGCFIYYIGHQASRYCPNAFIATGYAAS